MHRSICVIVVASLGTQRNSYGQGAQNDLVIRQAAVRPRVEIGAPTLGGHSTVFHR